MLLSPIEGGSYYFLFKSNPVVLISLVLGYENIHYTKAFESSQLHVSNVGT